MPFAIKELARALLAPTEGDERDLKRMARFLFNTGDWVHVNDVTESWTPGTPIKIRVHHDSGHAGSWRDRRSTTGLRVTALGFKLGHASATRGIARTRAAAEAVVVWA